MRTLNLSEILAKFLPVVMFLIFDDDSEIIPLTHFAYLAQLFVSYAIKFKAK
jgi:hypothetical protein